MFCFLSMSPRLMLLPVTLLDAACEGSMIPRRRFGKMANCPQGMPLKTPEAAWSKMVRKNRKVGGGFVDEVPTEGNSRLPIEHAQAILALSLHNNL